MKKIIFIAILIIGAIAGYFYWQHTQQPAPQLAETQIPPPPPMTETPNPAVRQVIEVPVTEQPLPELAESDSLMLDALAGFIGNKSLMSLFRTEQIIHNIVATIDNLPSERAPMKTMPIEPASGKFTAVNSEGDLIISPKNAARYKSYIGFAEAINAKDLVGLYIRLYPLFQQAYEELGYQGKYFNDRMMIALDDLLASPDIEEPVRLVQPKFYYQFADAGLEKRSIGQRILMRIGSNNEKIIKAKLEEIKKELLLHMHEEKVDEVP